MPLPAPLALLFVGACVIGRPVPEDCGDGIWSPFEACDPADPELGHLCRDDCQLHVCGDEVVGPDEDCDPPGPSCGPTCKQPVCGDGAITTGETCAQVTRLPIGEGLSDLRLGDFDGDGDLDLAAVTRSSTDLVLLLNDDGVFERRGVIDTGVTGHGLLVAPPDLMVLGSEGDAVELRFDGAFHVLFACTVEGEPGTPEPFGVRQTRGSRDEPWYGFVPTDAGAARVLRSLAGDALVLQSITNLSDADALIAGWQYLDAADVPVSAYARGTDAGVSLTRGAGTTEVQGPSIPLNLTRSRVVVEDEPRLDWLGTDGVLRLMPLDLEAGAPPDAEADVGSASWARFTVIDDAIVPVWVDDRGLGLRVGDEERRVDLGPGLEGLQLGDLNGDGRDDAVVADPATGELVVVRFDW